MSRPRPRAAMLTALAATLASLSLGAPAPAQAPDGRAAAGLARESLRAPLTRERFYFVMPDRFENGDAANDQGGLTGPREVTGFDPTRKGWYHGGDLKGMISRLDYIKGLGTSAIWLTPSFKNKPVQGLGTPFPSPAITATGSPTSPRSTRIWGPTRICAISSPAPTAGG
jgi:Alpha amylase, catalytic domain